MASDTSTAVEVKAKKEAQAEKSFLDKSGKPVDIEKASQFSYKSLADDKEWTFDLAAAPKEVRMMLALFGASTLATNTGSQNRQAKGEEQFASDTDAVAARFGRIEPGNWGTKPGGGGLGIDIDILYEAIVKAHGREPKDVGAYKATLASDGETRKTLRNHKDVAPHYDEMMRAKRQTADQKPLDSLLGF